MGRMGLEASDIIYRTEGYALLTVDVYECAFLYGRAIGLVFKRMSYEYRLLLHEEVSQWYIYLSR